MSPVREDLTAATLIRIAAMDLFAEQGYGDVIVRQIAAAAGVSPALGDPSLRFEGQFAAVLDERVAAFAGKRSPIWPGHPNSAAARASPSCAPTGSNVSRRWRATCGGCVPAAQRPGDAAAAPAKDNRGGTGR